MEASSIKKESLRTRNLQPGVPETYPSGGGKIWLGINDSGLKETIPCHGAPVRRRFGRKMERCDWRKDAACSACAGFVPIRFKGRAGKVPCRQATARSPFATFWGFQRPRNCRISWRFRCRPTFRESHCSIRIFWQTERTAHRAAFPNVLPPDGLVHAQIVIYSVLISVRIVSSMCLLKKYRKA